MGWQFYAEENDERFPDRTALLNAIPIIILESRPSYDYPLLAGFLEYDQPLDLNACPTDQGREQRDPPDNWSWITYPPGCRWPDAFSTSYGANQGCTRGQDGGWFVQRLTELASPSSYLCLADSAHATFAWWGTHPLDIALAATPVWSVYMGYSLDYEAEVRGHEGYIRHRTGSNLVFADGHAEGMDALRIATEFRDMMNPD
jgi:prepilin-type processing-associated H-X9-DG protein